MKKSKIDWVGILTLIFKTIAKYFGLELVKKAIEKLLIGLIGVSSGFQLWLVKFLTDNLMEEVVVPLFNAGVTELQFSYDKSQGKVNYQKLQEATDEASHDTAISDILS